MALKDYSNTIGWFMGSDDKSKTSYKDNWEKLARENVEHWEPIDELKDGDKND